MREIKFRAWDNSISSMMDVGEIHYCHGGVKVYGTGVSIGNGWATEKNGFKHDCHAVLMQYTSLKDKNGVEIYEGDVVAWKFKDGDILSAVEWDGPGAQFVMKPVNKDYGMGHTLTGKRESLEIIGNIYENPELINETS